MANDNELHRNKLEKINEDILKSIEKVTTIEPDSIINTDNIHASEDFEFCPEKFSESYINKVTGIDSIKVKSEREIIKGEIEFFEKKKLKLEENLDKINEYIESITESKSSIGHEQGWTKPKVCFFVLLLVGIIIASLIEIFLSYGMLTGNIPEFEKYPFIAVVMGLIPVLASVSTKISIHFEKNKVSYIFIQHFQPLSKLKLSSMITITANIFESYGVNRSINYF